MSSQIDTQDVKFDVQEVIDKTGLDLEDYLEIYELFQENFSELMIELTRALEAEDPDLIMRTAHTLKGSTSNIGFLILSEMAKKIQEKPDDFDQVSTTLPQMRSMYEVLNKQVTSIAKTGL